MKLKENLTQTFYNEIEKLQLKPVENIHKIINAREYICGEEKCFSHSHTEQQNTQVDDGFMR